MSDNNPSAADTQVAEHVAESQVADTQVADAQLEEAQVEEPQVEGVNFGRLEGEQPEVEGPTVEIHIVSPSAEVPQPCILGNIETSTTVTQLKDKIQAAIPRRPSPQEQRLIFRGRMLSNGNETLASIFRSPNGTEVELADRQTIHLVLTNPRDSAAPNATPPPAAPINPFGRHGYPVVPANAAQMDAVRRSGIHGQNPIAQAELDVITNEMRRAIAEGRPLPQPPHRLIPGHLTNQQGPQYWHAGSGPNARPAGQQFVHAGHNGFAGLPIFDHRPSPIPAQHGHAAPVAQVPLTHADPALSEALLQNQLAAAQAHAHAQQMHAGLHRQAMLNNQVNPQHNSGRNSPAPGQPQVHVTHEHFVIGPDGQPVRVTVAPPQLIPHYGPVQVHGQLPPMVPMMPNVPFNGQQAHFAHYAPGMVAGPAGHPAPMVNQFQHQPPHQPLQHQPQYQPQHQPQHQPQQDADAIQRAAEHATRTMTGAMHRSASGASLANLVNPDVPVQPIAPGVTTPIVSGGSRQGSRTASPAPGPLPQMRSGLFGPGPLPGTFQGPVQWPAPGQTAGTYLLQSPAGRPGVLIEPVHPQDMFAYDIPRQRRNLAELDAALAEARRLNQQALDRIPQPQVATGVRHRRRGRNGRGHDNGNGAADVRVQPHPGAPVNVPAAALLAWIWPYTWLIIRLGIFIWWFTSSDNSWYRWITVSLIAMAVFAVNTGLLNDVANRLWAPIRAHLQGLLPRVDEHAAPQPPQPPQRVVVAGQPADNVNNAPNAGAQHQQVPLDPAQVAARLIEQRQRVNANRVMHHIRRAERAMFLFLASIAPGVAEHHIGEIERAAREERERTEREAAEQERARAEEAQNAEIEHTNGDLDGTTAQQGQEQDANAQALGPETRNTRVDDAAENAPLIAA